MSLFGGSAPPSRSSYESDTSESSSARSSPAVVEISDPHNTQEAQKLDLPIPLSVNDDMDTDTESEENESQDEDDEDEEEEPARPNQFDGVPRTWQTYTESDRQIVESLEQMENSDLSAHLYNAHAIKRRLRRPAHDLAQLRNWYRKDDWLKSGKDLIYTDAAAIVQEAMVPPDEWTAWPLSPKRLPNHSQSLDDGLVDNQTDNWAVGDTSKQEVAEELREELLAVFLRIAKDGWNMRETPSSASDAENDIGTSRSRSQSESTKPSASHAASRAGSRSQGYSDTDREITRNETSAEQDRPPAKKRGRKPQNRVLSKPVILTDDARAQQLLQPSIHSMMSKLDELGLAICRTRFNHISHGESGDSSMSEYSSGVELSRPASRYTSRAASRATSRGSSRVSSRSSSRAPSEKVKSRSPSTRPPSRASSVQATQAIRQAMQDLGANTADVHITSGDSSDWESFVETPRRPKRRRSAISESDSDTSMIQDGNLRAGLMDWSEVLGLAAVKGWDAGAVARTSQRCATLFGESMSFMPFNESQASKPIPKPVWYTPSTTTASSILSATESPAPKRPLFHPKTLNCPHMDCEGHKRNFASTFRVIEHCSSVHGYDPRTNDAENEERMAGGVHIDGFLQPITLKSGWLVREPAKTGNARKKQAKTESSSRSASKSASSAEE